MAQFKDLLLETRPGLREAPDPSLLAALRRSAQRFCRESGIWREDLDPFELTAGEYRYEFDPPSDSLVERVLSLKLGTASLPPERNQVRYRDMHPLDRTVTGMPTTWSILADGRTIAFWRTPGTAQAGTDVEILAVLQPTKVARELPDFLADEWHDAIVAGAKAEMMLVPGMPWSNVEGSAVHKGFFESEIARAKREQHSEHSAPVRIAMRPFV